MAQEAYDLYNDRIAEYLRIFMDEYIFDELTRDYLEKVDALDVLDGVPVPIKKTDLAELTNVKIAHGMAMVLGCDINFKYRENYLEYIHRAFGNDLVKPLINDAMEAGLAGDNLRICACFRAALQIDPDNLEALFGYARACKTTYEEGEGEEFIGMFKAEALDSFEKATIINPDFEMPFYYLGYAYLNLGLYRKALLTFQECLELMNKHEAEEDSSEIPEEILEEQAIIKEDVEQWIDRLQEPIIIEEGYNKVLSGRFVEGIETLLPYVENPDYENWWPLHYYLGTAYKAIDMLPEAEQCFLRVLKISPSDISTMEELIDIYESEGDIEMADKYRNKIKLVERNHEEERAQQNPNFS